MMRSAGAVLLLISFLSACSRPQLVEQDLYGLYVANHRLGRDELRLRPDGTYSCTLDVPGEPRVYFEGRWSFDPDKQRFHAEQWFCSTAANRGGDGPNTYFYTTVRNSVSGVIIMTGESEWYEKPR